MDIMVRLTAQEQFDLKQLSQAHPGYIDSVMEKIEYLQENPWEEGPPPDAPCGTCGVSLRTHQDARPDHDWASKEKA
jgi:hypothetical protein